MLMYILCNHTGWNIVLVSTKRVFNFFSNQFKAGENIENEGYHWDYIEAKLENKTEWQGHYIKEDEFFDKNTV